MKKLNIIVLLSALLVFTSCLFEQKDMFDKTPAERMDAFLKEYQTLLESSENGWLLEYYPDSDLSYGGYVYFLTFSEGEVSALFQLASDISKPVKSLYKMTPDDGPILSFDTYNSYIHYFATPTGGSGGYQGYRGDTEFKVMGKSADNSEIYLVGRKSGNPCTLVRNEDYNPVDYLQACNAIRNELKYKSIVGYDFCVGDITGEAESNGESQLNHVFYFGYPEDGSTEEDAVMVEGVFPFCTTPEGLKLFEPVEIDGSMYDFFYFDSQNNRFVSDDDYVSINMKYTPISEQITEYEWYISKNGLSSPVASIFSQVETNLSKNGDAIEYLAFGTAMNKAKAFGLQFKCKKGSGTFTMNASPKDDNNIGLKYSMKGEGDQTKYLANMRPVIDCFGLSKEKTFSIETDNFKAPTMIKLTDTSDPTITITLVTEKTAY